MDAEAYSTCLTSCAYPGTGRESGTKNGIPGYRNVVDEKDRKILYRNISAGLKGEMPTEVGFA